MIDNKSHRIELLNSFDSSVEVELYASDHWTRQADFPGELPFSDFSVASLEDRLYVFGKLNIHLIKVGVIFHKFMIFRYLNGKHEFSGGNRKGYSQKSVYVGEKTERGLEWTAAPNLLKERQYHRSVTIENQIYHIGGDTNIK